jgi:cysteine synthase
MKVHKHITELIGKTPLLKLHHEKWGFEGNLYVKLESFNPGGSVKDRLSYAMLADAQQKGILASNSVIIEPSSGNTGIGLAMVAATLGIRIIITMPESVSLERRALIKAYGAELVLTPADKGMKGAIAKAEELAAETEHSFIPMQFANPANSDMHRRTTGPEIWNDTDGNIDIFVAGVGTGGTITGAGEYLRSRKPDIHIVAVEPEDSPVLSGGNPQHHKIQGIGPGFIHFNL